MHVRAENNQQFINFNSEEWLRIGSKAKWISLTQEASIRDYWNALKNTKNIGQGLEEQRNVLNQDNQKLQQILEALKDKDLNRAATNAKKIFLTLSTHSQRLVGTFLNHNHPTLPEFHNAILQTINAKVKELHDLNKGQLEYDPQNLTKITNPYHSVMLLLRDATFTPNQLKQIIQELERQLRAKTQPQQTPSTQPVTPPSAAEPLAQVASTHSEHPSKDSNPA